MSAPETCGGYCCERFHLRSNATLERVQEDAKMCPDDAERRFVADMLIPLGESTKDLDGNEGVALNWFTCKHFDTTTRLCKVYEQRPRMCRDFNMWWNPCGMSKCRLPKPEAPEYMHDSTISKELKP